jgi:hypothetical protein
MYIPVFALRKREIEILGPKLNRLVTIKELNEPIKAFIVDNNEYNEITKFVEGFRECLNESEQVKRPEVLRAVTLVFNLLVDAQKIKDPDIKTAAMSGISSSITSIMMMAPEYGSRLISIIKSKM